jgi:ABC-type transport system substrate-binding protein
MFFREINTYDPLQSDNYAVMQVTRNIFAPLVSNYIGGQPEGMIAERWETNADGKIWRFKLRQGLIFEDGSPIRPIDILMSFKRIFWLTKDEDLALNNLLPEIKEWKSMNNKSKVISIEKDLYLVFKFNKRPVGLLEIISHPLYSTVHPSNYDEAGNWRQPLKAISSGQYSILKRDKQSIWLKTRKMYSALANAPAEIEISWPSNNNETVSSAFDQGKIDLAVEYGLTFSKNEKSQLQKKGIKFEEEPPLRMHFIELNFRRDAFKEQTVRQIFRNKFLQKIIRKKNIEFDLKIDASFIPKGGVGYRDFKLHNDKRKVTFVKNREVKVLIYPYFSNKILMDYFNSAVVETLKDLGFNIKTQVFNDRMEAVGEIRKSNFDVVIRGSGILVNNPYADLRMMFLSKVGARIPDPTGEIGKLIVNAENEPDPRLQSAIVTNINNTVFNDAAVITFAHSGFVFLHRGNVSFENYNIFADPIEFRALGWGK